MKVLLINKFLYPKGGDAVVTLETGKLLEKNGDKVVYWGMQHELNPVYKHSGKFVSNIDFNAGKLGVGRKIKAITDIWYSFEAKSKVEKVVVEEKPDIVHLNNFAHQISPSVIDIFKKYSIPVVMTMHDYKLVCPAYSMLSGGRPCEKCKDGKYFNCLLNKCTKGSMFKSLVNTAEMYLHHNIMHIYDYVKCYISPSRFMFDKVKEMGLQGRVEYLPNFIDLSEYEIPAGAGTLHEPLILYVGRLSSEKGVMTLVKAAIKSGIRTELAGDGPLRKELEGVISNSRAGNVKLLGFLSRREVLDKIRQAAVTVMPSECYENNPRAVLESFALGTPVIGSRIGGIPELVVDNLTGWTYEPFNPDALAVV
ncbi:MAG: glycosyltransferase family 4 protein, partial [Elusimicrobiota bacterium]